jgi:hypothetical protein
MNHLYAKLLELCDQLLHSSFPQQCNREIHAYIQQIRLLLPEILNNEQRPEYTDALHNAIIVLDNPEMLEQGVLMLFTLARMATKVNSKPAHTSFIGHSPQSYDQEPDYEPTFLMDAKHKTKSFIHAPLSSFTPNPKPEPQTEIDKFRAQLLDMSYNPSKYTKEQVLMILRAILRYLIDNKKTNNNAMIEIKNRLCIQDWMKERNTLINIIYGIYCMLEHV